MAKLVRRISWRRTISLTDRSRMETSRGPKMRKRTAIFQQGFPGSRRSRYQNDFCARLVGKRYRGPPKVPIVAAAGVWERILPWASISRGLGRGIQLVLLTGNASDFSRATLGFAALRSATIKFGGKSRNGSQSMDLLRCECDADYRSTRNDLKEMNGVGTEIKQAVIHAHTVTAKNLSANGGEFCLRGGARSDEQILPRKA